jgi:predicted DNA-binding transcriptional regulator YafY
MADALLRQWHVLRAIPRAPAKIGVTTLHRHLGDHGYNITRRQLQRDLNTLSRTFDIQSDERGPAFGWSWSRNATVIDLPAMDGPTALMLKLVELYIPSLMPNALNRYLAPYFNKANAILKEGRSSGVSRWTDCVRVVPREMPLLPPKPDAGATRIAYDALLTGKRFMANYSSRVTNVNSGKEFQINPLGLVVRGSVVYLVCTLWDYTDVRQLALHRLRNAHLLEQSAERPADFTIDNYIAQGEFQYPLGSNIKLNAIFDRAAAAHLYETPLSPDQQIVDVDPHHVRLTATVQNTKQLEWWILGFGELITIIGPTAFRDRIHKAFARAASNYMSVAKPSSKQKQTTRKLRDANRARAL